MTYRQKWTWMTCSIKNTLHKDNKAAAIIAAALLSLSKVHLNDESRDFSPDPIRILLRIRIHLALNIRILCVELVLLVLVLFRLR